MIRVALLAAALAGGLAGACAGPRLHCEAARAGSWRTDPAWHDGLAECCVYEATRTIYGQERHYRARAYTNKERVDEVTTCKSATDTGLEVFKHHWSEIVPTENYDYRFSSMSYTRAQDLEPYKLSVSTQEDCGASYKEAWRAGSELAWRDSVYFPGAGQRAGAIEAGHDLCFTDALTLVLRDFDFEHAGEHSGERALRLVPSQKDTHQVSFEPVRRTLRYAGRSLQELPIGKLEAHALELLGPAGEVEARYWFAADGSAPLLHVLVRYEGPGGVSYRLASLERKAYWKRA